MILQIKRILDFCFVYEMINLMKNERDASFSAIFLILCAVTEDGTPCKRNEDVTINGLKKAFIFSSLHMHK
jgi:hypothetical protein